MHILWKTGTLWTSLPPKERDRQRQEGQGPTCCRRRPWRGQQGIWAWRWLGSCIHACCGQSKVTWSIRSSIISPKRRQQSILWDQRQSWQWCYGILHVDFHAFKNRTLHLSQVAPLSEECLVQIVWTVDLGTSLSPPDIIVKSRFCHQTEMFFHSWSWILQKIQTCDYCTIVHTAKHIYGDMPCRGCTHQWRIRGWLWQSSKELEETSATWKENSWSFGGPKADLLWDVYGQIGLLEGEVSLKLSSEAKPVQLSPRAVPQSIMPQLKKELDKMEGIIRAWTETTKWLHNLVTAVKKDGTLRLCLGPRNLNRYLIQTIHNTASWRDVQHSSRDGQFFSTLDAKSGYWTKQLNEQRQLLTAFNTPFKKYCFRNQHAQVLEVEPTRSQSLHEERHWPYYYWMAR